MSHREQGEDCVSNRRVARRAAAWPTCPQHVGTAAGECRPAGNRRNAGQPVRRHGIYSREVLLTAAALALAACASSEPADVAGEGGADTPATAQPIDPVPDPAQPAVPAADTPLTAQGWGPLTIGMTLADLTAALGADSDPDAVGGPDPASCNQFRPARAPENMLVMVEDGRLTRISLTRESQIRTDRGLALGVPAAAVRAAYGETLKVTPHKYEESPAEYLTVWAVGGAPGDGEVAPNSRGIQYEVNASGNVGAIHAGGPSIMYVEGCA